MSVSVETLMAQYYEPIRAYIYSRVHNNEVSEDITQDVFIKVCLHLHELDTMQNVKSWIYRVARNRTIDYHRSQQYRNDISPDLLAYIDTIETDDIAGVVAKRIDVQRMLSQLPELWRHILILHHVHGYTYEEVDSLLHKRFTKEYAQRAKAKLREVCI